MISAARRDLALLDPGRSSDVMFLSRIKGRPKDLWQVAPLSSNEAPEPVKHEAIEDWFT